MQTNHIYIYIFFNNIFILFNIKKLYKKKNKNKIFLKHIIFLKLIGAKTYS